MSDLFYRSSNIKIMSFIQDRDCYPTVGQLERDISQKINALYYSQFAHRASKVDCHLFDRKIIILCEEVITPIEKLLLEAPSLYLIHQVRGFLDSSLKTKIEDLIEKIVRVKVIDCVYNTNINNNSAVGIILLANSPQVRSKKNTRRSNRRNVVQFSHSQNRLSKSNQA